jgi:hypothetical protein
VFLAGVNCQKLHCVATTEMPRLLECTLEVVNLELISLTSITFFNLMKWKEEASPTGRVPFAGFKRFYAGNLLI